MLDSSSIVGIEGPNMLKEMGNQNTSGIVVDAKATESDSSDVEVKKTLPMENVSHYEKEAIDGCKSEDSETKTNGLPNSTSESEEVIEDQNQSSAVQDRVLRVDSSIDDRVVANREDGSAETETPSVEGESIEMSAHQGNCDPSCNMENTENCIRNEKGVEDHPKVGMGSSLNAPPDLRPVSKDTSALECEINDEYLSLGETLTGNKSSSGTNTFHVDQTRVGEEVQGTNDVDEMVKEIGLVEAKDSVRRDGKREEEKSTVEEIGTKSSALCEDGEDETSTEECSSEVGSPLEIKKVNKPELGHLFPCDILTEQLLNKGQVLQTNGVESSQEKFSAKSESSLEIEKLNQLEPELELVFLEQYTNDETSRLLVSEPNGGEITVKSESSLEIKKVDKPEPEPEPGYAFPKQYSVDKTLSIQVLEPNPGENVVERCKLTSESSSEIKKVSEPELEPEPEIEPRHVFSEQHPGVEKSTLQLVGPNGAARILEKSKSLSESSFQIKKLNESEFASKSECKPKAEPDSKQMLAEQYSNKETSTPQTIEKLSTESNPNHPINQLELRKSPSFDFGLPFDSRSEESDQTPLLYQDRTAPRRFSSYITPLHHEAVEVEEKTIRMERSTSDVSRSPFLNLSKEEKPENFAVDKDEDNGLKSSLSTEECDGISTQRNGKRKPRSSLFTTCICCTSPSAFS
ncbi:uncharacterized protein [Henckelia pumila]|uniref:uncharacterized protein isoform X2 n=1 Tax=Henckelia pumila TaxID=405737 RepID=UPI003C6E22F8